MARRSAELRNRRSEVRILSGAFARSPARPGLSSFRALGPGQSRGPDGNQSGNSPCLSAASGCLASRFSSRAQANEGAAITSARRVLAWVGMNGASFPRNSDRCWRRRRARQWKKAEPRVASAVRSPGVQSMLGYYRSPTASRAFALSRKPSTRTMRPRPLRCAMSRRGPGTSAAHRRGRPAPCGTRSGRVETNHRGIHLNLRVEALHGVRIVAPVRRLVQTPHQLHVLLHRPTRPA